MSDAGHTEGSHEHGESRPEQIDRNLIELLNELRVTGTGIQVLLAFLLVVPFNAGYKRMTAFDKDVYGVALVCLAASAILLIAPSVHHRILFRHRQRAFIVGFANRLAIVGMGFLAVGLTAILVLLGNVVFGAGAAAVLGIATALAVSGLWFAIPVGRRLTSQSASTSSPSRSNE